MDFIERFSGFSPDGGSGSYEMMYAAVTVAACVALLARQSLRAEVRRVLRSLRRHE